MSLADEQRDSVLGHPIHLEAMDRVRALLDLLRTAKTLDDLDQLQRRLFAFIYVVEEQRANCSRVLKRLAHGETIPKDAKPLRGSGSGRLAATWEAEELACERATRQYRSVGDAMAWTLSGFRRRYILALSRNEPAGPMADKAGLPMELGTVEALWETRHHFGLLHDLTNCLRIGDISEFTDGGGIIIHEVKASPGRKKPVQFRRMEAAIRGADGVGPLPGSTATLVSVSVPYRTEARRLADLARLTVERGVQGMPIPGRRAVVGVDLEVAHRLQPDQSRLQRRWDEEFERAQKRAGIAKGSGRLFFDALDSVGQAPTLPPWGIYPISTVHAARLAADLMMFKAVVSLEALSEALAAEGLDAKWDLPPDGSEPRLSIIRGNRRLTVNSMYSALQELLVELVDVPTWTAAIRELLSRQDVPQNAVIVFQNEHKAWAKPKSLRLSTQHEQVPTR